MASRLYEIAFRIGGKIASSFPASLKGAAGQLDQVSKQISRLEGAQGQVTRFRQLHNEIDATKQKLGQAEAVAKHLGSTMGPLTADMAAKLGAARANVEKLNLKYREQVTELGNVKRAMEAAGVSQRSLKADSAKLGTQLANAQKLQQRLQLQQGAVVANNKAKDAARSKFDASKGKLLGAAAGVAAVAIPAVVAAKFEDSMVRAGALAHSTDEQMAAMTAQARQLGRDTRFSASQAAEGMQYLAMSGFKANEIMSSMPGMLNIAGAGMVSVGEAADITSNILRGFGMDAGQAGRLGDVLTNTFTNSNTTLGLLGDTMKYVAPKAAAVGLSLEKTAAAAAVLANAGIKGEQAGTGLRAMLIRLAAPPKKARDALHALRVETMDAKKNLLPLDVVLASLNKKMAKLGSGAKEKMVSDIFGTEASTAATVLLSGQASGALAEMTSKIAKSGTAAEIAAKQNATMAGQLDNLKGSVEDVGIALGNKLIPMLKDLVDTVVPVINRITAWSDAHPKLTQALIVGAAAVASLNLAMVSGGYALNGMRLGLTVVQKELLRFQQANKIAMLSSAASVGLVVAGVAGLGLIAYQLYKDWKPIKEWWEDQWDAMGDSVFNSIASVTNGIAPLLRMAGIDVGDMEQGDFLKNKRRIERNSEVLLATAKSRVWKKEDMPLLTDAELASQGRFNMFGPKVPLETKKAPAASAGGLDSWLDQGGLAGSIKSLFSNEELGGNSTRGQSGRVTYSPTINLPPGSTKETEAAAQRSLEVSQREFKALMDQYMKGQGRLSFGQ